MKFNQWTLGLAAIGVVSLASAVKADEKPADLLTAVSSTTLSGYVNTSIHWDPGTGNAHVPGYAWNTPGKADGFNLDVAKISITKPQDETPWASGYEVDLMFGPDANAFATTPIGGALATDFAIRQAYVALRTPIGNGIDWKVGVWDTIIGYESFDAGANPNYTRSYGYTLEPTTHTGVQANYKVNDSLSFVAAIANTTGPIIGGETINSGGIGGAASPSIGRANPPKAESYKTYMGAGTFTAPKDWGFLAGSSFTAGVINGWGGGPTITGDQINLYAGATLNTPVTGLRAGLSYDYFGRGEKQSYTSGGVNVPIQSAWANAFALYSSYQATEKLSINTRAEYLWQQGNGSPTTAGFVGPLTAPAEVFALTCDVQYDLWKNVISRLEVRWDRDLSGQLNNPTGVAGAYGGPLTTPTVGGTGINAGVPGPGSLKVNNFLIALNLIYTF